MRKIHAAVLLSMALLAPSLTAAEELASPVLVADFSPGAGPGQFRPYGFESVAGRLFFLSSDSRYGIEPWVSDGTGSGTHRLADICPGACSSYPRFVTAVGDRIFFFAEEADDAFGGASLFVLQGESLESLGRFGYPYRSRALGSEVYFAVDDGSGGQRIYRSDGTRQGTREATELCAGASPCHVGHEIGVAGGALYYISGEVFYGFFPATGERRALAHLQQAYRHTPLDAARAVFIGCPAFGTCQPWVTDGSAAGTFRLTQASLSHPFFGWQGRIYWRELTGRWASSDGTAAGTRHEDGLLPFQSEVVGATPERLFYVEQGVFKSRGLAGSPVMLLPLLQNWVAWGHLNGKLFFTEDGGSRLFASDGTPAGTSVMLAGPGLDAPGDLLDGYFYCGYASGGGAGSLRRDLWRTDGTTAGTRALGAPQEPRPNSSELRLHPVDDVSLLAEVETFAGQDEQWQIDPVALAAAPFRSPTVEIVDSRNGFVVGTDAANGRRPVAIGADADVALADVQPANLAIAPDRRAYFTADAPGQELWETDGTPAGTRLIFDLDPGWTPGYALPQLPLTITPSGDNVFFIADGNQPHSLGLWCWRRGDATARRLVDNGLDSITPLYPAPGGSVVFRLLSPSSANGMVLWVSDGTAAGTRKLLDLPEFGWMEAATVGRHFFFSLDFEPEAYRTSLWVSDLTPAGTLRLTDPALSIRQLVASGERAFFAANSPAEGAELWFSDGSAAGTGRLDLEAGPRSSSPRHLFSLGDGRVVFAAAAGGAGNEPWISDGSAAGTFLLADLAPGPAPSSPRNFERVGERLFFRADDGATGNELWALNLPPAPPPCPAEKLCLRGGRFEVAVEVTANGQLHQGKRVLGAEEAGVFSFFSGDNWEMLVKVLDGCAIDDSFWVYASAATDLPYELTVHDRWSGLDQIYTSAAGPARPILDGGAFETCAAAPLPPLFGPSGAAPPARTCADDPETLCLGEGGRFRVSLDWETASDRGRAQPVAAGSADSGLFTFFSPGNWEMMVKLLDGCAINGKRWVFAAGTTDVGWTLRVTDRTTGAEKVYVSELGQPSKTVTDGQAFDCAGNP
jgi:ELWxxDGT repeat protein